MTDLWQQEATDGILVFTGLLSASVAALLTISVQISGQTLRTPPHSVSRIFSRFLLTQTSRYHAHPSLHHSYTTPVLSTDIRRLGEFTVVLELCNQFYV